MLNGGTGGGGAKLEMSGMPSPGLPCRAATVSKHVYFMLI